MNKISNFKAMGKRDIRDEELEVLRGLLFEKDRNLEFLEITHMKYVAATDALLEIEKEKNQMWHQAAKRLARACCRYKGEMEFYRNEFYIEGKGE